MKEVSLPDYTEELFNNYRYKVLYGGRGSAKSYSVARILLLRAANSKRRVLCAREFQNSITESVHKLLSDQIDEMGLSDFFDVTATSITGVNGSEFIFKGVRMNISSIKSMVGITDLWLEEAHTISKESWDVLIPTIREPGSEIWVTFNPDDEDDPTYKMFVDKSGEPLKRDDALILKVNWDLNPWFPDVLAKEKDYLYRVNPDLADHVWGGNCRKNSAAQIFRNKWVIREFEPEEDWDGPYFGADFGFAEDPAAIVKIYLNRKKRELLFRYAKFGYAVEIDYLPDMYDQIPGSREHKIRGDNSRPETISFVARRGFEMYPAEKWAGSVEDGIEWMRNWETIVFHPDCCDQDVIKDGQLIKYGMNVEAKNYSYKTDRLTGDVLTDIVDAYNHGFDAARYALEPLISNNFSCFDVL